MKVEEFTQAPLALTQAGVFLANCLNRLITFLASLIPPVPDGGRGRLS